MSETTEKPNYKKTLNLPKTSFPMKASLIQNEPASLKRWDKLGKGAGLYAEMTRLGAGRKRFVFHDGPPYANGSIHLGHLMNKCLKDFVVRSKFMAGFDCPYVPGWDCHGLPIEHKVMTDMVESGKSKKLDGLDDDTRRMAIRKECKSYASKQIKIQSKQMQRLLTTADYENPYLTMVPKFEHAVLEVLGDLLAQGLVYKALKPVHWSIANETALADAELEYQDREDLSVFVDFEATDAAKVYEAFGLSEEDIEAKNLGSTPSFMIWTTTPWTLPANLAIAVHERFEYALVRVDGNLSVLATELVEKVTAAGKSEEVEILATTKGKDLMGLGYKHPLIDADAGHLTTEACFTVVSAEYVTLEDGTGLVHTAPGHGSDDYLTGIRVGLPVYCPVQGDGTYDQTVPEAYRGGLIWDMNETIANDLRTSGHLFHSNKFMHSYPHDWRSKTPVIFRATEQWFVGVDRPTKRDGKSLRDASLEATGDKQLEFVPAWGRNRMRGMLESRPDWCISRQRAWGLPIPAFVLPDGSAFMTEESVRAVAKVILEKGSDAWFQMSPAELLAGYDTAADPQHEGDLNVSSLTKGSDILDVWFESGSSWNAVMIERSKDNESVDFPIDLYLEGSDQHRGWFQLSLLTSMGAKGQAPFKTVLTHGFCMDRDGKKLSKSAGHTIENLFEKYGADVLRWWVSSLAYESDVKVDEEFFVGAGESYRKVRNTIRFLLSNLEGFEPEFDSDNDVCLGQIPSTSLEAWVLGEYDQMRGQVLEAYEKFQFHVVQRVIYNFCNTTLSAEYLTAVKDRLYCDKAGSERRVRTQRAMHAIADGLCTLLAPIMCHTADEAWRSLRGIDPKETESSVHLAGFASPIGVEASPGWPASMKLLGAAMKDLEDARNAGKIENPLDAGLRVPDPDSVLSAFDADDLADFCGVSRFEAVNGLSNVEVQDLRHKPRCERSWKRDPTVKMRNDGGMLCDRDAAAVGVSAD